MGDCWCLVTNCLIQTNTNNVLTMEFHHCIDHLFHLKAQAQVGKCAGWFAPTDGGGWTWCRGPLSTTILLPSSPNVTFPQSSPGPSSTSILGHSIILTLLSPFWLVTNYHAKSTNSVILPLYHQFTSISTIIPHTKLLF